MTAATCPNAHPLACSGIQSFTAGSIQSPKYWQCSLHPAVKASLECTVVKQTAAPCTEQLRPPNEALKWISPVHFYCSGRWLQEDSIHRSIIFWWKDHTQLLEKQCCLVFLCSTCKHHGPSCPSHTALCIILCIIYSWKTQSHTGVRTLSHFSYGISYWFYCIKGISVYSAVLWSTHNENKFLKNKKWSSN